MKNREKFRKEILEALAELFNSGADGVCRFMKKQVFPSYDLKKCAKEGTCGGVTCIDCAKMFAFWLDEEYKEPPTDWVNVPVDTLVRVRDDKNGEGLLRYFCEWDGDMDRKYRTFPDGRTSKTATCYLENWRFCELVEDSDESK